MFESQLLYLIGSKILHDLAAPLGAVSMGLEMMAESPSTEHIHLLQESMMASVNKLQLYRSLIGYGASLHKPTFEDIQQAAIAYFNKDKYSIIWLNTHTEELKGEAARLILGLILIAAESCPRGATVTLHQDYTLHVHSEKAQLSQEILSALLASLPAQELNARLAFSSFCALLASKFDSQIIYEQISPQEFTLAIRPKNV